MTNQAAPSSTRWRSARARRELCALHEAAGLRVVSAMDNAGKPFTIGSSRLWLVTHKA